MVPRLFFFTIRSNIRKCTRFTSLCSLMATLTDRAVGGFLVGLALAIFVYYTLWVIVLPFLEPDHFLRSLFLPPEYAILLPVAAGVVLLVCIGLFVGVVLIKDNAKRKAKKKL